MLVFIVERKFLHKEIVNDGVDVQLLVGFRVVTVFQILLNCPNLIFYGIKQRSVFRHFILKHDRQSAVCTETVDLIHSVVELKQITAVGNRRIGVATVHNVLIAVLDVHAVGINLHFLTQEIVSHMTSVDNQFHIHTVRTPSQAVSMCAGRAMSYVESNCIAQRSAVHPVGKQLPALVGRQSLYTYFLVEFKRKGKFREVLRGVAAKARTA